MGQKLPISKHSAVIPDLIGDPGFSHDTLDSRFRGNDIWKRFLHFFTLLTLREAYLACRNFLGLILHPFKTIKIMRREKDPVQTLLIFGLPFYFWLGGVAGIIVARKLISIPLFPMGYLAKSSLFLISLISSLVLSYLAYWTFVWWRKR